MLYLQLTNYMHVGVYHKTAVLTEPQPPSPTLTLTHPQPHLPPHPHPHPDSQYMGLWEGLKDAAVTRVVKTDDETWGGWVTYPLALFDLPSCAI